MWDGTPIKYLNINNACQDALLYQLTKLSIQGRYFNSTKFQRKCLLIYSKMDLNMGRYPGGTQAALRQHDRANHDKVANKGGLN